MAHDRSHASRHTTNCKPRLLRMHVVVVYCKVQHWHQMLIHSRSRARRRSRDHVRFNATEYVTMPPDLFQTRWTVCRAISHSNSEISRISDGISEDRKYGLRTGSGRLLFSSGIWVQGGNGGRYNGPGSCDVSGVCTARVVLRPWFKSENFAKCIDIVCEFSP